MLPHADLRLNVVLFQILLSPPSYRFLLVLERRPKLLQFRWDRRAGQLQGFNDITSIANLIFCDEGVGVTLEEGTRCRDV